MCVLNEHRAITLSRLKEVMVGKQFLLVVHAVVFFWWSAYYRSLKKHQYPKHFCQFISEIRTTPLPNLFLSKFPIRPYNNCFFSFFWSFFGNRTCTSPFSLNHQWWTRMMDDGWWMMDYGWRTDSVGGSGLPVPSHHQSVTSAIQLLLLIRDNTRNYGKQEHHARSLRAQGSLFIYLFLNKIVMVY
jgi:hypothetical protein